VKHSASMAILVPHRERGDKRSRYDLALAQARVGAVL
jgi:hypothetical protein